MKPTGTLRIEHAPEKIKWLGYLFNQKQQGWLPPHWSSGRHFDYDRSLRDDFQKNDGVKMKL